MNLILIATFATGIGLIVLANMLFYMILGEVNAKLPNNERIGAFFVNYRNSEVLRRHRDLYPDSRARMRMRVITISGFAMIGFAFVGAVIRANT